MDAKIMLEAEGYYVGNLWHISDVQMNFDCTEQEAMQVLRKVFNNDWIEQYINDSITVMAESMNLKRK